MILPFRGKAGVAFLVPRYEGGVLIWKWSIVDEAVVFGKVGSKAFAAFAVFIMLQAISYTSHIKTDIEYSARHDGQILDGKGTDAIKYQKRIVEVKGVV